MVQSVPSGETWIWNAVAYAASQSIVTSQIVWLEPRSTCSHWGSLNALDQRVPVLPSTAADAGNDEFSSEEAEGPVQRGVRAAHDEPVPPAVP